MELFSLENLSILNKLLIATFLGGLIGLEREMRRKHAGLRTYALICLGATLFTVLSVDIFPILFVNQTYDAGRVIAYIIVGIGFLGAGAIVLYRERLVGLTSAAAMWVVAAIGVAVGMGSYGPAIFTTLLVLFILIILRWIEEKFQWGEKQVLEETKD